MTHVLVVEIHPFGKSIRENFVKWCFGASGESDFAGFVGFGGGFTGSGIMGGFQI